MQTKLVPALLYVPGWHTFVMEFAPHSKPAGHTSHDSAMGSLKPVSPHDKHVALPFGAKVPASQGSQSKRAVSLLVEKPGEHAAHSLWPSEAAKRPAGQSTHTCLPAESLPLVLPTAQSTHAAMISSKRWPPGHVDVGIADGSVVGAKDGNADGAREGIDVGARDGIEDGASVGAVLGISVGRKDGAVDGTSVGARDGSALGRVVGGRDGASEGTEVGTNDGTSDGAAEGSAVGAPLGGSDGTSDGAPLGEKEGSCEGTALGSPVGADVGRSDGSPLGERLGLALGT